MRTRTRMRLYEAAGVTAGDARRFAERAGGWLEGTLVVKDPEAAGAAAATLQAALSEHLAALAEELSRLEELEYRERHRARGLRRTRDEQAAELSERLVRLRTVMTGLYGRTAAARTFGRGKTPRQPDRLLELANGVVAGLRGEEPLPEGGAKIPGSLIDAAALARHLEAAARALEATLDELADRETAAGVYLVRKQELGRRLEQAQQDVARVLGGIYRLGGQERLDERVRKNHARRRPRRRAGAGGSSVEAAAVGRAAAASMAGSEVLACRQEGPGAASDLAGIAQEASASPSEPVGSPEEASMTSPELLSSAEGASGTASEALTSSGEGSCAGSEPPRSSEGASFPRSEVLGTRPEGSAGPSEELRSRPEGVSGRNAHGSWAWHPVRSRQASGATPSHQVSEGQTDGAEARHPILPEEATGLAA